MGKAGFIASLLAAPVMGAVAFILGPGIPTNGAAGLCLPAPIMWPLIPVAGWIINMILILASGAALYLLNKSYTLVRGTEATIPLLFIFMAAANPWISGGLSSSAIMAVGLIICMAVMFGCYRQRNATQEFFAVATVIAVGSMFQYGFALLIPWIIITGFLLKCFRFKEAMALILGLAAPYWVALGLGMIDLSDFALPQLSNISLGIGSKADLFTGLAILAVTALISLVLALDNTVRLYAGNTQRRLYNVSTLVMGLNLMLCMIVDYTNFPTYIASFYIFASIQVPSFFTLRNLRGQDFWTAMVMLFFLGGFIAMEMGQSL